MPVFHWQIERAEDEVKATQRAYLQRFGWEETCNTPGAYWLWRRDFTDVDTERLKFDARPPGPLGRPSPTIPYGIVTASTDLAISMTVRCLDDQAELTEEDAEA